MLSFQSVCLSRQPFIESHLSEVPSPLNCNDIDIKDNSVELRPLSEPTAMSANAIKARLVRAMNKLYINNGAYLLSFEFVLSIDSEIKDIMSNLPWYLQVDKSGAGPTLPRAYDFIRWQHHLLHTFVSVQRIRMFRPFLQCQNDIAHSICVQSAESALDVYRSIRIRDPTFFLKSHRFICQCYQTFSTAIILAVFLLVEKPSDSTSIRADVEMSLEHLHSLEQRGTMIPMATDGVKVLRKILEMYDSRSGNIELGPVSLVPAIYSVIGGKIPTQRYLERCKIGYIVHHDSDTSASPVDHMERGLVTTEMPITPSSSIDFEPYSADATTNPYPVIDFDLSALGSETYADQFFWQQWDF
jgi:hypothetical protein